MAAGQIVISLLLATGSFESDTARASKALQKFDKEALAVAKSIGTAFGAAAVGAAAGLAALVSQQIDAIDRFNDLADASGASVEKISGLDDVARRTGATFETVETTVLKLNQALSSEDGKNGIALSLKALGLSADELRKADPADAVLQVATALAGFEDNGNKARITAELFGKATKDVAAFLKDLAERGELVTKVTKEQAEEAEKYNKTLSELKANTEDFARAIGLYLIPKINQTIQLFRDGAAAGKGFFATLRDEQLKILGFGGGSADPTVERLKAIKTEIEGIQAAGERQGLTPLLERRVAALKAEAEALKATTSGVGDFSRLDRAAGVPRPSLPVIPGATGGAKADSKKVSEAERYLESLQKQVERTQELTTVEQVLADIQAKRIAGLTPKLKEQILATAAQVDQGKRMQEQLRAEEQQVKDMLAWRRKEADERKRATDQLDEENVRLREEIAIIAGGEDARRAVEKARVSSAIAILEEKRALDAKGGADQAELAALDKQIAALRERQGLLGQRDIAVDLAEEQARTKRLLEDVGETIGRGLEDAIVNGKDLRDVLKGIAQDLLAITTRKLITEPFSQAITGTMTSGGGGGGFNWGSIISAVVGAYTGGSTGNGYSGGNPDSVPNRGGRAYGGPVEAGGLYKVNERGRPEMLRIGNDEFLLMGSRRGYVDPNTGGGGGAMSQRPINVNINQSFAESTSEKTVNQAAAAAGRRVQLAIARNR